MKEETGNQKDRTYVYLSSRGEADQHLSNFGPAKGAAVPLQGDCYWGGGGAAFLPSPNPGEPRWVTVALSPVQDANVILGCGGGRAHSRHGALREERSGRPQEAGGAGRTPAGDEVQAVPHFSPVKGEVMELKERQ
ncbi:hypothetical protein E2C01_050925 [Portunus trituberculatus]|uniref:Uncharacterized protein n=1 Tax=Portunus trituberculatus TaxID=210409 RepID=A0A5B7GI77_PORTR|nr:hypothetical protein [Portunus trituberculatus]